jgi:uncharacterized protein
VIFIDAGAFVARYRTSDARHQRAVEGWNQLKKKGEIYSTSGYVIAEAATVIGRLAGQHVVADLVQSWLASRALRILDASQEDLFEGTSFLRKYADQGTGYVDCVSFVLMKREQIKKVFGFDRHFRAAGFELWPGT